MTTVKECRTCKEQKPEDAFRPKRCDCRDCEREKHRAWYEANRESELPKIRERSARLYQQTPDVWKRNATAWSKANPQKRGEICKENMRRQRVKLADAYVRRMLAASIGVKAAQVPQQLVEVQRELLKLKRELLK